MVIKYFFILLNSFLAGSILLFLLQRFSRKRKVLISQGIPLVGGISMGLSFVFACLISALLFIGLSQEAKGIIAASLAMLVFGAIDDLRELSVLAKIVVQLIATTILVFFGVKTQIAYIGNLANIAITFIWVLGISNAFNHLDVIDGLTATVALMVSLSFLVISVLNGDMESAILTLALSGAILSFLIYNFPPAKVYMGNAGSHFLGFILAAIALSISYAPLERRVALLSPLIIMGLPIFDTAFLILMRLKKKNLPFKKSDDHLALRFLAVGYSRKKALLAMSGICLLFSLCGISISQVANLFGIAVIILLIFVVLAITKKMGRVSI